MCAAQYQDHMAPRMTSHACPAHREEICAARTATLCVVTGWEEGGSGGDEAAQPLLDKTDKAAAQRQSTVAMLISFSAQDNPLLTVAFLAGGCAPLR